MADGAPQTIEIRLEAVTRTWGNTRGPDQVTWNWSGGPGVVGLLGANGAGKTTLLRILAQTARHTAGTIRINDQLLDADSPALRARTAFVPHEPPAWAHLSVRQNLELFARINGASSAAASGALTAWDLNDVSAQRVHQLSRGWRQRYGLARADLIASPTLILLDEPTTGLDAAGRVLLEAGLERWKSQALVLVATHESDWVTSFSNEILDLGARLATQDTEQSASRAAEVAWA